MTTKLEMKAEKVRLAHVECTRLESAMRAIGQQVQLLENDAEALRGQLRAAEQELIKARAELVDEAAGAETYTPEWLRWGQKP
jgi:outer membrane murein-binding lipoprotein Lpp